MVSFVNMLAGLMVLFQPGSIEFHDCGAIIEKFGLYEYSFCGLLFSQQSSSILEKDDVGAAICCAGNMDRIPLSAGRIGGRVVG